MTAPTTDAHPHWTTHDGLSLYALDARAESRHGSPLVFLPGLGEHADEHLPLLEALAPRRAIAVDLRGRGRSDVPDTGYDLQHHLGDFEATVDDLALDRFHLAAFSRGSGYALGYAIRHPDRVASLTIGDYRANHVAVAPGFAEWWMKVRWRGVPMVDRMDRRVAEGLERESSLVPMWDELEGLACPLLVIHGGAKGAVLDAAGAEEYRRRARTCELVVFDDSGHDLWRPDADRFPSTLRAFLQRVDPI